MKNFIVAAFAVVFTLSFAACKSHEHPQGDGSKEHPEHPTGMKFDLKKEYTTAVNSHVTDDSLKGGVFTVMDKVTGVERSLELIRIHSKKIVKLGNNRYFACADFKDTKTGKIIDLDFYATLQGEKWRIDPALIHKVDGKPRFTYDADNNRVPIGS